MCCKTQFQRRGPFRRLFPTAENAQRYVDLFESEKYNNVLLAMWLKLPRNEALALIAPRGGRMPALPMDDAFSAAQFDLRGGLGALSSSSSSSAAAAATSMRVVDAAAAPASSASSSAASRAAQAAMETKAVAGLSMIYSSAGSPLLSPAPAAGAAANGSSSGSFALDTSNGSAKSSQSSVASMQRRVGSGKLSHQSAASPVAPTRVFSSDLLRAVATSDFSSSALPPTHSSASSKAQAAEQQQHERHERHAINADIDELMRYSEEIELSGRGSRRGSANLSSSQRLSSAKARASTGASQAQSAQTQAQPHSSSSQQVSMSRTDRLKSRTTPLAMASIDPTADFATGLSLQPPRHASPSPRSNVNTLSPTAGMPVRRRTLNAPLRRFG